MTKAPVIISATIAVFILFSISHFPGALSEPDIECKLESDNTCTDKNKAFDLKLISIFSILQAPSRRLLTFLCSFRFRFPTREISLSHPQIFRLWNHPRHVLPDSFEMLSSHCLDDDPWHKFYFTGFVAMISAVLTLMVDSITTTVFSRSARKDPRADVASNYTHDQETGRVQTHAHHGHGLIHRNDDKDLGSNLQLLRYRVIAIALELGIVVHSVVIGNNTCTIKGLIAAICFHQMFEGMGLGGSILQAKYGWVKKVVMAFFFAVTTLFGMVLVIAMSKTYKKKVLSTRS